MKETRGKPKQVVNLPASKRKRFVQKVLLHTKNLLSDNLFKIDLLTYRHLIFLFKLIIRVMYTKHDKLSASIPSPSTLTNFFVA
jgi:hypothetical protein